MNKELHPDCAQPGGAERESASERGREREGERGGEGWGGLGESPEHHGVKEGNMELEGMLRRVK